MTACIAYLALLSLYAIVYPADILKGNEHLRHDLLLSSSQRFILPFNLAKTAGSASHLWVLLLLVTLSSWITIAVQIWFVLSMWEYPHPFMMFLCCSLIGELILCLSEENLNKKNILTPHITPQCLTECPCLACVVPKHSLSVKCLSVHFVPRPEMSLNQWPPIISQHCGHAGYYPYPVRPVLVGAWREECWPVGDRIWAKCGS